MVKGELTEFQHEVSIMPQNEKEFQTLEEEIPTGVYFPLRIVITFLILWSFVLFWVAIFR